MKKNLIYVFTTLLLMCVCGNANAQNSDVNFDDENSIIETNCEVLKLALQKLEKKYGGASEEMAQLYGYVGMIKCDNSFQYSDAYSFGITCCEKAIAIRKKLYGAKSINVGDSYVDMALACGIFIDKAKQYVDSALVILRPKCGENSYEVGRAYMVLGLSYYRSNEEIFRVASQCMIITQREYYEKRDYEEIISNLENSLKYYKKAYNIYSRLGENYKESADTIKKAITHDQEEIELYKKELKLASEQS